MQPEGLGGPRGAKKTQSGSTMSPIGPILDDHLKA
jgi:hypothetical protein